MTSIKELKLDLEEFEKMLSTATRPKVKAVLEKEIKTLQSTISSVEPHNEAAVADQKPTNAQPSSSAKNFRPIKNFGWEGSSAKFVKIYVNLKGVGEHDSTKIFPHFETRSLEIKVEDFKNANYMFSITGLLSDVIPEQCNIKVKGDDIIVTLKKKEEKVWKHLRKCDQETEEKKKKKEAEEKKTDPEDPSASIMNLMKKMYDEGDDDMKRTIAKAWTESREKQMKGDDTPSMPDL